MFDQFIITCLGVGEGEGKRMANGWWQRGGGKEGESRNFFILVVVSF